MAISLGFLNDTEKKPSGAQRPSSLVFRVQLLIVGNWSKFIGCLKQVRWSDFSVCSEEFQKFLKIDLMIVKLDRKLSVV